MAQPTDESKTSILPESDLNPLQNPLLGAHMGRWAEVYFTSPPEKRAQAVSDLVRELSNNSMPERISSPRPRNDHGRDDDEPIWRRVEEARSPRSNDIFEQPVVEQPLIACESCGHKNVPQQRFCGMCGAPLASPSEALPFMNSEPISSPTWGKSEATLGETHEGQAVSAGETTPNAENHAEHYAENYRLARSQPWTASEPGPAEFSVLTDYQSAPVHHSYRVYVGLMVAILLGLLVYMTWRSNTAFWSSGTAPSELPKAVPAPSSEPPATAEPSTATRTPAAATAQPAPKTDGPATSPTASAVERQNPTVGQEKNQTADRRRADRGAKQPPAPRAGFATTASVTDEQNGSEELAAAEKYLNAGPGTARDSRQAATWLWKAVAKQNLTATLLLSDLYLRGDGVTKSCDQAHLLLDAAARKGASAAGERLRNLQAFGCR
ncbi:MAG TPA: hypothetical protein VMU26_08085 [Candidatus Polarisedimenticolia bacterium]|nr:hypothetical protein [Candidatus Polarisedimenticolia bacterium]